MAKMTHMQIMDAIRKALSEDPRPQVEIAKVSKIHAVNLSQFKAGTRELPLESLVKLAGILGLEITVMAKKKK